MKAQFIYGPVPSRRLGRSLGVDLVPYKVCSYDCIYCQIGVTEKTTLLRRSYVPIEQVLMELKTRLEEGISPDFVTLGGSGEPTLNADIGRIIGDIKEMTDIPVAVITNGSTLSDPGVREALMAADAVLPSFDAPNERVFKIINRPHPDVSFENMAQGLIDFRQEYRKSIWLEIFLVAGVNDTDADMAAFLNWCDRIRPDRIHLNTVARPPAENDVSMVSPEKLIRFKEVLGKKAEIIVSLAAKSKNHPVPDVKSDIKSDVKSDVQSDVRDKIRSMLSRRPCTTEDITSGLGIDDARVKPKLEEMVRKHEIEPFEQGRKIYYRRIMGPG